MLSVNLLSQVEEKTKNLEHFEAKSNMLGNAATKWFVSMAEKTKTTKHVCPEPEPEESSPSPSEDEQVEDKPLNITIEPVSPMHGEEI